MLPSDVFEEWTAYSKKKKLLERNLDLASFLGASESKIVAITGIRRAGKSSVLMLLSQHLDKMHERACYVNVEDSRLKGNLNLFDELIKWFGDSGYLLLDEITSADDWQGWLARTHEMLKGNLRLIVSSSRKTLAQPSKPLRGRLLVQELYPLSFKEFLNFKNIVIEKTTAGKGKLERALFEYLKYGGFPEVVLTQENTDKMQILNSYFKDIVGLDVSEISQEKVATVETFARYALQATYFSASKCLNFLKMLGHKIGKEKILHLEHCSQTGYLFFFMPIFSYNIKDSFQYPRKAYCGDTGFAYSVTGKFDLGRMSENAVFLELKRRNGGLQEICYWKNKKGLEVDFVIKQGNAIGELVQVCWDVKNKKTKERETAALLEAMQEFRLKKGLIITEDYESEEKTKGKTIKFVPLWKWLLLE